MLNWCGIKKITVAEWIQFKYNAWKNRDVVAMPGAGKVSGIQFSGSLKSEVWSQKLEVRGWELSPFGLHNLA